MRKPAIIDPVALPRPPRTTAAKPFQRQQGASVVFHQGNGGNHGTRYSANGRT